jgi:hypothetical protein
MQCLARTTSAFIMVFRRVAKGRHDLWFCQMLKTERPSWSRDNHLPEAAVQ